MAVDPLPLEFQDHRPYSEVPRVFVGRQGDGVTRATVVNMTPAEAAELLRRALAAILAPSPAAPIRGVSLGKAAPAAAALQGKGAAP